MEKTLLLMIIILIFYSCNNDNKVIEITMKPRPMDSFLEMSELFY